MFLSCGTLDCGWHRRWGLLTRRLSSLGHCWQGGLAMPHPTPLPRSPSCALVATRLMHKITVALGTVLGCMHLLELRDFGGRYSPPTSVAVGLYRISCTP